MNRLGTSAFILICTSALAPSAFADFTPEEALNRYFELAKTSGANVSIGQQETRRDTVIWKDIVISTSQSRVTTSLSGLEASPIDENTVRITIGPTGEIVGKSPDRDMPPVTLDLSMAANEIILREESAGLNAAYQADQLLIRSRDIEGKTPLKLLIQIDDAVGGYAFDGKTHIDGTGDLGSFSVSYSFVDDEISMSSETRTGATQASFSVDLPDPSNPFGFMTGAQNAVVRYEMGKTSSSTKLIDEEGLASGIRTEVEATAGSLSAENGVVTLDGSARGIVYAVQPPLPGFPELNASMTSALAKMNMTVGEPGEEAPFEIALSMNDVIVDEAVWGLFDPSARISRDPADFRLDLSGQLQWLTNDFKGAADDSAPPFVPRSMDLTELLVSFGGASISAAGTGQFVPETFAPFGQVSLELRGVLAMVGTLSELGLLPMGQALMIQGMLPQFTRPGPDGVDHLLSDIEVKPNGAIMVNGTQVK